MPLAPDFDSLVPAEDATVRTWSGDLVIKAIPARGPAASTFRLYDGTRLSYRTDGLESTFDVTKAPKMRGLEVHLPMSTAPRAVLIDGAPSSAWHYQPDVQEVVVELRSGPVSILVKP